MLIMLCSTATLFFFNISNSESFIVRGRLTLGAKEDRTAVMSVAGAGSLHDGCRQEILGRSLWETLAPMVRTPKATMDRALAMEMVGGKKRRLRMEMVGGKTRAQKVTGGLVPG